MHLRLPGHGETGPTLEIYSYAEMAEKPSPMANRRGLGHLAFAVDDVAEIVAMVILNAAAVRWERSRRDVPGVGRITFAYVTDPEGNIIEVQRWE